MAARRRKPRGATTRGGWGHNHQRRRAAIAPLVNAGKATCARCNEPIHAGEEWHLDHNAARDGYLAISHAAFIRRGGANKTNRRRRTDPYVEQPCRRSQRWHDDPPIGTIVLGHERVIYLGNSPMAPVG